jgi:hypothetical protein
VIAGKAVRRPLLTARTYLCVHAHAWLHVLLLPARVNRHACMHLHLSGRQPGQGIHARTGRHRLFARSETGGFLSIRRAMPVHLSVRFLAFGRR